MCYVMTAIRKSCSFLIIFCCLVHYSTVSMAEEYYRWQDQNGNVQYSFTRPAGIDYTVLDQAGRHLSADIVIKPEIAESQVIAETSKNKAQAATDNTHQDSPLAQLSTYDKFLLASYLNVSELERDYKKKTNSLLVQIENYKKNRQSLYTKIKETEKMLASATQEAAKEKLQVYLNNTQKIVAVYTQNITKSEQKIVNREAQYLVDKIRLETLLQMKKSAKQAETTTLAE